jgi:probable HAF family extracellular repeat protein
MCSFKIRHCLVVAVCILNPLFCAAQKAAVHDLVSYLSFEVAGALGTFPMGINDRMVVTGYYISSTVTGGFLRDADGTITTFAVPGAVSTMPVSINHAGDITGSYLVPAPPEQNSFVSSVPQGFVRAADGTITTFGNTLNGLGDTHRIWVEPLVINAAGEVVGNENDGLGSTVFTRSASGKVEEFPPPGLLSTDLEGATGINASGAIIGFTTQGIQTRGFLWSGNGTPSSPVSSNTTPIIADGSEWTFPTAINAEGSIVGCYEKGINYLDFVRDPEGTITTLYIPGAFSGMCDVFINDAGTIVSSYVDAAKILSVFIKPLHGEGIPFIYPGATMTTPTGLNNLDVITGYYSSGSATKGFILVPGDCERRD